MNLPHIKSRVNGMKIPLLAGQEGILHRFENSENKLVIESTTYNPAFNGRDSDKDLVSPATKEQPKKGGVTL